MQDLEDMHPLRSITSVHQISPFFGWIYRGCFCKHQIDKPNFKYSVKESLLQEMGLKMPRNDYAIKKDPYQILGYGSICFFEIMTSLMYFFAIVTLFSLPLFYLFSQGNHYDGRIL